eukprot:CAMPEP_0183587302 /NCGR_PEP_ID=MMETSP0371-20130417/158729_1 /TAXON_ID=268820 /ORGANISM="Peridinium aciculiferum, Strain PAER-2" /LENGTH=84 /DNA_ID=CAMNT_0025798467 /DNA_START=59 /DNA_END=309 /DNA_ORIENTATION=-
MSPPIKLLLLPLQLQRLLLLGRVLPSACHHPLLVAAPLEGMPLQRIQRRSVLLHHVRHPACSRAGFDATIACALDWVPRLAHLG